VPFWRKITNPEVVLDGFKFWTESKDELLNCTLGWAH